MVVICLKISIFALALTTVVYEAVRKDGCDLLKN